jgi:hypothetical protein
MICLVQKEAFKLKDVKLMIKLDPVSNNPTLLSLNELYTNLEVKVHETAELVPVST